MLRDSGGRTALAFMLGCALFAAPAAAQGLGEIELRDRFEGTYVRVKLDMPASEQGIDVYPGTRPALDFPELAKRLKRYGTSLRRGEDVQVTKVKVKKSHIEFQLGGGGYGTFGDDTDTNANVGATPKSQREKNLEQDLKRETDAGRRRRMQEEIDSLRRDRQRDDARNRAIAAEASELKKENLRARAAEAGSRFNVRYEEGIPSAALTPEGLMAALAEYVAFDVQGGAPGGSTLSDVVGDGPDTDAPEGAAALVKGMTRQEVEDLLGPPSTVTPGKEGTLRVERLVFSSANERVEALLVEGVLVRYAVTSK
jgi:hypothetical protein